MKVLVVIVLFLGISLPDMFAQDLIPFDSNMRKKPVLVDNIHQEDVLRLRSKLRKEFSAGDIVSDLTPEQRATINNLALERDKKLLQINNELSEKKAHLRTLESAENADMKLINKTIEEIGALITSRMKAEAECKQKIRQVLTEKQRVEFDLRK